MCIYLCMNLPYNAGITGLIPGLRKFPGGGNGNPLKYSCLGNLTERGPGGLQSTVLQTVRNN